MKRAVACMAAAVLVSLCTSARALPLPFSLEVDSSKSVLTVKATALSILSGSASTTLSSSASASDGLDGVIDLNSYVGNIPGSGTTSTGGVSLSNTSLSIPGLLTANLTGVHASIGAGLLTALGGGTAGNPGSNSYDIGGTALTLDAGSITITGVTNATLTPPVPFTLPSPTLATVQLGPSMGGPRNMTLTIPVNVQTVLGSGSLTGTVELSGNIVFTGIRVPEPGTMALLAIGLVAFVPVARRFRKNG